MYRLNPYTEMTTLRRVVTCDIGSVWLIYTSLVLLCLYTGHRCAFVIRGAHRDIFICFREVNRRIHSKPGAVPFVAERKKHIIGEVE